MGESAAVVPPLDAELAPVAEAVRRSMPPLTRELLPQLREQSSAGMPLVDLTVDGAVAVADVKVPGPEGAPEVTLLVLSPVAATTPLPLIYYVHGGGLIGGDRSVGVNAMLPYVAEGLAVVVSVEYRLAPEHPHPAPILDAYAGLSWCARNAADLRVDPDRLMVAGASAGGGLAASLALMARDRSFPVLSHQILICPMLDDRIETPSSQMLDRFGVWDRHDNLFGWTALLGESRGGPDVSPYAAPARTEDLAGLPAAYIDVGQVESFRDEAIDYARRLSHAGVPVDFHLWAGAFHGSDGMAPHARVSQASNRTRDDFIRRVLTD
jgi:acetyl esterase/lipase